MIPTNQSTVSQLIWTNERSPLCLVLTGPEQVEGVGWQVLAGLGLVYAGLGEKFFRQVNTLHGQHGLLSQTGGSLLRPETAQQQGGVIAVS